MPKTEHIRKLFSESWPLAVSALAVAMYMNIDVTMLMMMSGPGEAGVYSVAVQMSSVFYFLPLAMYSSFFPTMANSFSSNRDEFQPQYAKYVDLNVVFAYASIGIGWLAFPILIRFFFGNQYDNSVQPFQIHIFGLVFVFLGVSRGVFLTLHGLHRFAMLSTIAGAITNIAMNLLLIPEYKSDGAAAATIASHGVAAVLTSFCNSRTRVVGRQQLGAALLLNPLRRILRSATRS